MENRFGPVRNLLDASAEFVSPNNDTLYLMAALDLSAGSLVFTLRPLASAPGVPTASPHRMPGSRPSWRLGEALRVRIAAFPPPDAHA